MTSFTQPTVSNLKSLNMPAVVPHQTSAWLTSFHLFHVSANSVVPRKINTDLYSEHAVSNKSWEMLRREKAWNPEKGRERGCVGGSESGFAVGLSCLLVLRDRPILPRQEGLSLSQRTQAAPLAKAPWHGCGCCCQSVTDGSYSPSLPSHFNGYSLWQTFIQSLCRSYSLRGCKA